MMAGVAHFRPRGSLRRPACRQRYGRRDAGTAYVVVLSLMIMVFTIAMGAMLATRSQARAAAMYSDTAQARVLAQSAVEMCLLIMDNDPTWRRTRSNGYWISNQPLGVGTVSVSVVNPLGVLNRSDADPITITGVGNYGNAMQRTQIVLAGASTPYSCLSAAMVSGGLMSLGSSTVNAKNQTLASNAAITALLGSIDADVESILGGTGLFFLGSNRILATSRTLPNSNAFDFYTNVGVAIPITSIGTSNGSRTIERVLISPKNNPYGGTKQTQGIYVIDCQNQKLVITNCRIVGTLVLLNPGSGTVVQGSVSWVPAVSNYPGLMVQGNLSLAMSGTALSEATISTNLNPTGTPYTYPSGTANVTVTDSYPSRIDAMVYASGDVTASSTNTIKMLIANGSISVSGTLNLSYDATCFNSPPSGFRTVNTYVSPGSWQRMTQ